MASLNRMIIIIDSILTIPQLGHSQRKRNDDCYISKYVKPVVLELEIVCIASKD